MQNVKHLLWLLLPLLTIVHLTGHAKPTHATYLNASGKMLYCRGNKHGIGFSSGTYIRARGSLKCAEKPNCAYNADACTTAIISAKNCTRVSSSRNIKHYVCCIKDLNSIHKKWPLEAAGKCKGEAPQSFKISQGKWVR